MRESGQLDRREKRCRAAGAVDQTADVALPPPPHTPNFADSSPFAKNFPTARSREREKSKAKWDEAQRTKPYQKKQFLGNLID